MIENPQEKATEDAEDQTAEMEQAEAQSSEEEVVEVEIMEAEEEDEETDSRDQVIAKQESELEDMKGALLRARADLENFRKRSDRERQDHIKFANRKIFLSLLEVLDNFDRALTAVTDPKDNFVIGVKMIQKQLVDVLTQNGVEMINPTGRSFDPYLDEAIASEISEEHEENTILEVFQNGFRYHGTLLRPSKVKVASTAQSNDEKSEDEHPKEEAVDEEE